MAVFSGNTAILEGGGIKCDYDCDVIILFDGSICFENNQAMYGGGMYLGHNSKLILSSSIQTDVFFILNHAQNLGGALYIDNSECYTFQKECFLSFYGDNFYTATRFNLSLSFLNNSAGFGGSTLYGGQLNKCKLRFIYNVRIDKSGNRAEYGYRYDIALVVFTKISRIRESSSVSSITSQPERIKICEGEKNVHAQYPLELYPGEEFNISVIALDQTGSPVPATIFVEKKYYHYAQVMDQGDEYRLSPSR